MSKLTLHQWRILATGQYICCIMFSPIVVSVFVDYLKGGVFFVRIYLGHQQPLIRMHTHLRGLSSPNVE